MGGLFGDKTRTVFEEKDIGRAPFSFKDPFEALVSPDTAQERPVDVPESGAGPEPIAVGRQVTAKAPGNSLLRALATYMAIGGRTGLANTLQRQQDAQFEEAEANAERRSLAARKAFEKRQAEQPQFTFDKSNDRITVINPLKLKSGNFKDAVKFISLRDPKATIAGVQESLGVTLTEAEQKGLAKIIESGDEVLFRQTVDKIGKRSGQEAKEKEFQELLPSALEDLNALQQEKPFSPSEKTQGELAIKRAIQTLSIQPLLDHAKDIRNERIGEERQLRSLEKMDERQFRSLAALAQRMEATPDELESLADAVETGEMKMQQVPIRDRAKVIQIIQGRGGVVLSDKQREAFQKSIKISGVVAEAERISAAVNTSPGVVAPAVGLARAAGSALGVDDAATQLQALKITLGPLARGISEEVGVLTDRDIGRVEAAVPTVYDSQSKAQAKLAVLRRFAQLSQRIITLTAGRKLSELSEVQKELETWRKSADTAISSEPAELIYNPKTKKLEQKK